MDSRSLVGSQAVVPAVLVVVICCALSVGSACAEQPQMLARMGVKDQTSIVKQGRPHAVIVFPENDAAYRSLVMKVQTAIKAATGVTLPIRSDREALKSQFVIDPALKKQNLILLGNLNTNRALVQLAANFYLYSTSRWPGKNGFEFRTITNPFGTKTNCIFLGGSAIDGVEQAVVRFVDVVAEQNRTQSAELMIPRQLQIVIDGKDQVNNNSRPSGFSDVYNGTYDLAVIIEAYQRTGSAAHRENVRRQLRKFLAASRAPAASDYGTECAVRALDLVDSFLLSDQENRAMDNLLLNWVQRVVREKPFWNPQGRTWLFGGHQACGAMAFFVVTNYLLKNGAPNEPALRLLLERREGARRYLNYLSTSFKDRQKDVGWETWTPLGVLPRYALAEGDLTYFESRTVVDVIRRHFYAGRGFGPAGHAAFVFNDGRYKSLALGGDQLSSWAFVMDGPKWVTSESLKPEDPDFLIGTKVMRASPTDWDHARRKKVVPSAWYTPLPYEKTFHVVGFADGVRPTDALFVLGGWDSIGSPGEANSIRMFRHDGHQFLFRADGNDQRKPRPGRFYQNSIVVESGNYSAAPPCAAELLVHHDGPAVGMVASRLNDFHGVDWTRHISWRRGRYYAVIDVCRVKQPGPLTIVNQWWNRDVPGLKGNRWIAHTDRGTFHLLMADPGAVSNRQWWNGGPYQLRQSKHLRASAGQVVSYLNLIYVDDRDAKRHYEVRRLRPTVMLVRGSSEQETGQVDETALIGCRNGGSPLDIGRLRIQSNYFFLSPSAVALDSQDGVSIEGHALVPRKDGRLSATDAGRLKKALQELWNQTAKPQVPKAPAGFLPENETEPRFTLTPQRAIGIQTGYRPMTGVAFEKHDDGSVTWDLGRPAKIARIDGIRVADKTATVQCSSDDFKQDNREITAATGIEKQWVYYEYGYASYLGVQTIGPLNDLARFFRVKPPKQPVQYGRWIIGSWHGMPWNITAHNPELFKRPFWQDVVFRSDQPEVNYTKSTVVDLNNDGCDELVVATDQNELLVLAANAKLQWRKTFDAPVLSLICEDLDGDALREVICATHDHAVYAFDWSGKQRFQIDILSEQARKSGANGLSVYRNAAGQRELAVSTYHQLRRYDRKGRLIEAIDPISGMYLDSMPVVASDFTHDGIDDFVLRDNVHGHVTLVDGRTQKPVAASTTRQTGRGLAVLPWRMSHASGPGNILVIAESGLAMMEVTSAKGESSGGDARLIVGGINITFSLPIAPIVAWDVSDLNSDGTDEIVVATRNGALIILDERGRVIASTVVANELYDFAVLQTSAGNKRILAATETDLRLFDTTLHSVGGSISAAGGCRRIEPIRTGESHRGLCLFRDGKAAVVSLLE